MAKYRYYAELVFVASELVSDGLSSELCHSGRVVLSIAEGLVLSIVEGSEGSAFRLICGIATSHNPGNDDFEG